MSTATIEETNVTINVTQDDVDHGEREVCERCPIARAAIRAVPTATRVSVGSRFINFRFPEEPDGVIRRLPLTAERFISDHDTEGTGKPFSFPVSLPTHLLAPIATEDMPL